MAAGDLRPVDQREVRLEAVHLHLERRDARRAHAGVSRHGDERQSAADASGARDEEVVPRGELAGHPESHDRVGPAKAGHYVREVRGLREYEAYEEYGSTRNLCANVS